jgi:hypothetical protein
MAAIQVPLYKVGDILKVRVFCSAGPQVGVNVLHYKVLAANGNTATPDEIGAAIAAELNLLYKSLMPTEARYERVGIQRIVGGADLEVFNASGAGPGTAAGSLVPPQVSPYLTMYVGPQGRRNRGRVYVPFASSLALNADGTVAGAYLTAMGALANALIPPVTVNGAGGGTVTLQYAIFHKATQTADVTVSFRANTKFGTQVRRSFTHRADALPGG